MNRQKLQYQPSLDEEKVSNSEDEEVREFRTTQISSLTSQAKEFFQRSSKYILCSIFALFLLFILVTTTSDRTKSDYSTSENVWLIGTMTPYYSISRRLIHRNTWQKLYSRYNITNKFILANPSPTHKQWIENENNTYGDLIVLSNIEEDHTTAMNYKGIEFLKYCADNYPPYTFVSRLDDDAFLNVPAFVDQFLIPNLVDPTGLIIARDMADWDPSFHFPGTQFCTLSWDILKKIAEMYNKNPIYDQIEDALIGYYLNGEKVPFRLMNLRCEVAFDYDPKILDVNKWNHKVSKKSINPHKMKTDETFLEVANMFDEQGINMNVVDKVNSYYSTIIDSRIDYTQGIHTCSKETDYTVYNVF